MITQNCLPSKLTGCLTIIIGLQVLYSPGHTAATQFNPSAFSGTRQTKETLLTIGDYNEMFSKAACLSDDGGFLVAGTIISDYYGTEDEDILLTKFNTSGDVEWMRFFGEQQNETVQSIRQTDDGGYIAAGGTTSFGTEWRGLLIKFDASGNMEWVWTLGDSTIDHIIINDVKPISDGGYVFSADYYAEYLDPVRLLVGKVAGNGSMEWAKVVGVSSNYGYAIEELSGNGYLVAGVSTETPVKWTLLLKFDSDGDYLWSRVFTGLGASDICMTDDGGCAILGAHQSGVYLIKLDQNQLPVWSVTIGDGVCLELGRALVQTKSGDYLIAGITEAEPGSAAVYKLNGFGELIRSWWINTHEGGNEFSDIVVSESDSVAAVGMNRLTIYNSRQLIMMTGANGWTGECPHIGEHYPIVASIPPDPENLVQQVEDIALPVSVQTFHTSNVTLSAAVLCETLFVPSSTPLGLGVMTGVFSLLLLISTRRQHPGSETGDLQDTMLVARCIDARVRYKSGMTPDLTEIREQAQLLKQEIEKTYKLKLEQQLNQMRHVLEQTDPGIVNRKDETDRL